MSFPSPDRRAHAKVQFEHDGVQFATAQCWDTSVAYFVQDNIPWCDWNRITKTDYEMVVARCKADPTSQLIVTSCDEHRLTFVFWPAEVDLSGYPTERLVDPAKDEEHVTIIKAQMLPCQDRERITEEELETIIGPEIERKRA